MPPFGGPQEQGDLVHHVPIPVASTSLVCSIVTLSVLARPALATIPPEIPLVDRPGVGVRALGMGSAYVGVAEDYHALNLNPAGLAQLRRVEFGAELQSRSIEAKTTYLGNAESVPLDKGRIQSLGFAYPFPTYRGSLVIGFSYERVANLDQDYYRTGAGGPIALEQESILEDGSLGAYQAGFAFAASPTVSLGVTGTIYSGRSDRDRTFEYRSTNGVDRERTTTRTEQDISAVSGSLGALVSLSPEVRLGFALHLPENFTLSGSGDDDVYRIGTAPPDTVDVIGPFNFEDELTLPFRVATGLSYAKGGVLLAADLAYADWKQIDYYGPIRGENRDYAYRSTVDLRFGAEYTFAQAPVRLRAGVSRSPVAYRLIGTDVFDGIAGQATFEHDRISGSVGASVLLDESVMVDVAYVVGGYERRGTSPAGAVTTEKLSDKRLYLGATFRL